MAYLLDTCTLSELAATRPHPRVVEVVTRLPREDLFLSTITMGEFHYGIEQLPNSARKQYLVGWFEHTILRLLRDQTLPVDSAIALQWGALRSRLRRQGRTLPILDSLIAATALEHGLTLVTRNESDFLPTGVPLLNPWS